MINVPELINQQSYQRMQWLSFSKAIPANSNGSDVIQISDDGHFHAHYIGGQFTTLTASDTDGGACGTSVKLIDNGRRWDIIDNLVPMSLFCTPGRQRASAVAGDPGNPLFYPIEFEYTFLAGTTIRVEFANNLAFVNTIWLIFYGEKLFKEYAAPTPRNQQ